MILIILYKWQNNISAHVLCLLTVRVVRVEQFEDLRVLSKVKVVLPDILNLLGYPWWGTHSGYLANFASGIN